jgi:hypothetical protein
LKIHPYSSLAAFLAHYRALKSARDLGEPDRSTLSELAKLIESTGIDVAALDADDAGPPARHRERAERRLRIELLARGALVG